MATAVQDASTTMFESEATLFTRTGDRILVRPVTREDRPLLVDFFHNLTPDDIRFRFLATLKEVGDDRIDELCRADYPASMTFLAFHDLQLVAIATLAGDESGRDEVALSTHPDWKNHGVSWTLLEHVVRFAREHGAKQISSIEHGENRAAIQLEHDMGFGIRLLDASTGERIAIKSV